VYGLIAVAGLVSGRCRSVWLWCHALLSFACGGWRDGLDGPNRLYVAYALGIWFVSPPLAFVECWIRRRPLRDYWMTGIACTFAALFALIVKSIVSLHLQGARS
jgi:hypothetical protein